MDLGSLMSGAVDRRLWVPVPQLYLGLLRPTPRISAYIT